MVEINEEIWYNIYKGWINNMNNKCIYIYNDEWFDSTCLSNPLNTLDHKLDDYYPEYYEIKTLVHKEIYIGDPRKSSPEKLKTILRYHIKEKE